ncbi:MAG TPA: NDP-sugar synthase [Methylomirabilota bacterium]|nr:NDP-sugar synthase [Methylomirabilota bacterium]
MILAGGQGTRLRPLTLARAKPVVPLLNRPFLAYQLALLGQHGVSDVILACSYRVEDIQTALGTEMFGTTLRYVVEKQPLGTGGGVRNAADLARGRLYVLNGDILTDVDLTAMARFHEARRAQLTILLTRVADPRAYGLVETDHDGRIRRFREKPASDEPLTTDTVNAGVYLLDAELLFRIPADRAVSIERDVFPALIADGVACFAWCPTAYWRDIGSPEAYRLAQMDLLDGRVRTSLVPGGHARGPAWVADDAVVAPQARLEGPAVIGPAVRVEARARVGPRAVIGAGSSVGPGAQVEEAVVWERVRIGAGAILRECVIANDAQIGTNAVVTRGAVVEAGAVVGEGTRIPR